MIALSAFGLAECTLPIQLPKDVHVSKVDDTNSDIQRNKVYLEKMCMYEISFQEHKYKWKMLLVTHPDKKGPFWFLPHDNENTAFDAAVYAVTTYGGGFLAVESNNQRYFAGQDPNRNFGETEQTAKTCANQHYPAPKYSRTVFQIIDALKPDNLPYLALHNNANGWRGNGGSGGVSILNSSRSVQSYPASGHITSSTSGLMDEDSLIYIAGTSPKPPSSKLARFVDQGINTRYEVINEHKNDCSMSNYVVLSKGTDEYINIESEHGDLTSQLEMIDKIMKLYGYSKISNAYQTSNITTKPKHAKTNASSGMGLYVCYNDKVQTNNQWQYQGCQRQEESCVTTGKRRFGRYPDQVKAASAYQRCIHSTPKFVD